MSINKSVLIPMGEFKAEYTKIHERQLLQSRALREMQKKTFK